MAFSQLKELFAVTLIFDHAKTMANITGDGNYTSKLNQTLNASPTGIAEFFSALNMFLSITASLGNALILVALHKVSSIFPPTKGFFRCLAVTDLCVGLIVQPLYATHIIYPRTNMNVNDFFHVDQVYRTLSWILCGVSVLTSTAISVDRLLALLLGLRYKHVVTLRRARVVIICVWFLNASGGLTRMWREDMTFMLACVILSLSLITASFCYTRIHFKLRHQQALLQNNVPRGQPNEGETPLNIARYKKTVSTIMWVQLALVACYVPWGVVDVLYLNGKENQVVWNVTGTLVFLNSSLNPILYCWKIREVRRAVKATIRLLKCF